MPPRFLTLTILAFWLGMTGWLAYRDLWPHWRAGEPPPYSIDLADEARRQSVPVLWTVYRRLPGMVKDEKIGRLHTWVVYHDEDDSFELHGEMNNPQFPSILGLQLIKVESLYRITRSGDLRETRVEVTGGFQNEKIQLFLQGDVRGEQFFAVARVQSTLLGTKEMKLAPVAMAAHGSMLNPLHPVNRIAGLRPGQRWRMPLVDPLADALGGLVGSSAGVRFLDARVADEPRTYVWNGREVPCLVIEYQGDEVTAQTWVRQTDGLVVRQEASRPREGEIIVLQRE